MSPTSARQPTCKALSITEEQWCFFKVNIPQSQAKCCALQVSCEYRDWVNGQWFSHVSIRLGWPEQRQAVYIGQLSAACCIAVQSSVQEVHVDWQPCYTVCVLVWFTRQVALPSCGKSTEVTQSTTCSDSMRCQQSPMCSVLCALQCNAENWNSCWVHLKGT